VRCSGTSKDELSVQNAHKLWPRAMHFSTIIPIHTLSSTGTATLWQINSKVSEHPLRNPDLAPSDDHVWTTQRRFRRMPLYNSDLQMTQALHAWLVNQPENIFFSVRAYRKLWPGWLGALEIIENMVKKCYCTHSTIRFAYFITHPHGCLAQITVFNVKQRILRTVNLRKL
jgi:hypothetical protein